MMLALLSLLCITIAQGSSFDPFSLLWESVWREETRLKLNLREGHFPKWLWGSGRLVRNAGGAFEAAEANSVSPRVCHATSDGICSPSIFV